MPTVVPITVPPEDNGAKMVSRPQGSVLSRAIPVARVKRANVNMVIYGENRVGKSTLACQFPKPLLVASYEPGETGGTNSLSKIPGVEVVFINNKTEAITLAKELRGDTYYKTHVHDTCTSLQNNIIMRELMNLEAAPVQLNWGAVPQDVYRIRSEQAKEVMQLFRDLPVNTIFVAQQRDHNKGDESRKLQSGLNLGAFFAADLGPGTVKWMHDACDFICQLYLGNEVKERRNEIQLSPEDKPIVTITYEETGRSVRRLRCILDKHAAAGFRSSSPEIVPEYIETTNTPDGPKKMYEDVMRVIRGEKALKGYYPKVEDA